MYLKTARLSIFLTIFFGKNLKEGLYRSVKICYTTLARETKHVLYAPVAQLDRVTDSDSVGHWFESSRAYQKVTVSRLLTVTFIFCFARALVINAVRKHSTTLRVHSHQFDPIFHCIQAWLNKTHLSSTLNRKFRYQYQTARCKNTGDFSTYAFL